MCDVIEASWSEISLIHRLGVFHVRPRDCAILILLSGYVKAPPGGVLLVACILGTDSNYGNMTSPMKVHLSASERSAINQLHLLEKASFWSFWK